MTYRTLPEKVDALADEIVELRRLLNQLVLDLAAVQRTALTPEMIEHYCNHKRWPDGPPIG